jgi:hypothetical protein
MGKHEGNTPPGKSMNRGEDNVKTDLKEKVEGDVGWTHV